jgi:hypothetical protein
MIPIRNACEDNSYAVIQCPVSSKEDHAQTSAVDIWRRSTCDILDMSSSLTTDTKGNESISAVLVLDIPQRPGFAQLKRRAEDNQHKSARTPSSCETEPLRTYVPPPFLSSAAVPITTLPRSSFGVGLTPSRLLAPPSWPPIGLSRSWKAAAPIAT